MRKNLKTSRKNVLKIAIIILMSTLLCLTLFLLANNLAARKSQVDSLNSASDDLNKLYTKIATNLISDTEAANFQKVCYQSSAKLSHGSIRCGGEGKIVVNESLSYESQKQDSLDLINQSSNFVYKTAEDIHDDKTGANKGFAVHFVHNKTGILCDLILELQQYEIVCLQTVPDFLPDYTIEK